MRWIAALLALGLLGAGAFYLLEIRDRRFQSYAGAEIGMEVEAALNRLQNEGYTVMPGSSEINHDKCSGAERYVLVRLADPTYSLTVSPDNGCKVIQIARRMRGWEL